MSRPADLELDLPPVPGQDENGYRRPDEGHERRRRADPQGHGQEGHGHDRVAEAQSGAHQGRDEDDGGDEDQTFFFFRPRMPPLRNRPAPRTKPKLYQVPLLWTS